MSSPPLPGTVPSLLFFLTSTDVTYPPRRLLLHTSMFKHHDPPPPPRPLPSQPPPPVSSAASSAATATTGEPYLDANVIMILAVLLCALICAVGLNSILRCALRCFSLSASPSRVAAGGVKKAALKSIPTVVYGVDGRCGSSTSSGWSECAICLSEFKEGERVRVLPGCSHGFHVRCVDRWLRGNTTCPTCRGSCVVAATASGQKKAVQQSCAGSQAAPAGRMSRSSAATATPPPPPPRASAISPLDREGVLVEGVLAVEYMGR